MATAAIIGEALAVEGYALAGAAVYPAESQDQAAAAWRALPPGTALVIMTASAAGWLNDRLAQRPEILTAVLQP
jgi:vacuolar-type H+-ATPase subunit F/Vma7